MKKSIILALFLIISSCGGGSESPPSSTENVSADQAQFLIENANRDGVVTTASGLQYEVLIPAEGPKPNAQSTITVHYVGELTDGTEFDSSYSRGEPATFVLDGAILGWVEGVQLMSVGSKYRFVMPPSLAYEDRGAGSEIGPNEVLVFEIELLEINT